MNLDIDLREMKGTFRKRYPGPEGGFLTYYWVKDYIKLNQVFPELWKLAPDFIFVAEIDGGYIGPDSKNDMGPHIDYQTETVLNWYQKANECVTYFYEPKPDKKPFKAEQDDTSNLYTLDDVDVVNSFTAKDNDLYLLNVSKIHSVKVTQPGPRLFLNVSWSTKTFEEISELIRFNTQWN